jgi:cytoskeletal protein CcmA (bactofilin family)
MLFKENKNKFSEKIHLTTIDKNTSIRGNIISTDDVKIDGSLIGDIESTGKLVVGELGCIMGNISVSQVIVDGNTIGSILSSSKITINPSGVVTGKIYCNKLEVKDGASLTGTFQINQDNLKKTFRQETSFLKEHKSLQLTKNGTNESLELIGEAFHKRMGGRSDLENKGWGL